MMKKAYLVGALILSFSFPQVFFAADIDDDTVQVDLHVEGCNNNGMCEAVIGEDVNTCSNDCYIPPSQSGGAMGYQPQVGQQAIFFNNVDVATQQDKTIITWQSTVPTLSTVRWGRTQEFKEGSSVSTVLIKEHSVELTGLQPGAIYYFTIESQDKYGTSATLPYQLFFTPSIPDTTPPQNPNGVSALVQTERIVLSWNNPANTDFSYVRIMRSEDRFQSSPFLGTLVYEGRADTFIDTDVQEGVTYFYTLFSRDRKGNYSSGTGIRAVFSTGEVIDPGEPEIPTIPIVQVPFSDFTVVEKEGFSLAIPAHELPKNVQDIWVEVRAPSGEMVGNYLFTYSVETGVYQASVPTSHDGEHSVRVFGYVEGVKTELSEGSVRVTKPIETPSSHTSTPLDTSIAAGILLLILIIMLFLKRFFGL